MRIEIAEQNDQTIELQCGFMKGRCGYHYHVQIFIRDHNVRYADIIEKLAYIFESPGGFCRMALIKSTSLFLVDSITRWLKYCRLTSTGDHEGPEGFRR